jgi:hypothetical protein
MLTRQHHSTLLRLWWQIHHLGLLAHWHKITVAYHRFLATREVLVIQLIGCLFLGRVAISSEIHNLLVLVLGYCSHSLAVVEKQLLVGAHLRLAFTLARLETGSGSVHVHRCRLGLRAIA